MLRAQNAAPRWISGGPIIAPLWQRDVGVEQGSVGEVGGVSYSGGVQDGEGACALAPQTGLEVDIP